MKKALKITGYIFGILIIAVVGLLAYIRFADFLQYSTPDKMDLSIEPTPARLARGEKIVTLICQDCHMGKDNKLSGMNLKDLPPAFGKFYSANITQDSVYGIGRYTEGDLFTLLRTGLRPDGTHLAIMPKFNRLSDEDVYSLISFLKSDDPRVQPSQEQHPIQQYTMLSRFLGHFVMKPAEMPKQPIPNPDTTDAVAWGRYLALDAFDCYSCHSASFTSNNGAEPEKSKGFFGGGNQLLDEEGKPIYTANLTPDKETGIGNYSEEEFLTILKFGKKPDGTSIRYPMKPFPQMTDGELKALYAYLRTVPAIKNDVDAIAKAQASK